MDNQIVHQKLCAVEGCENKKHAHIYCGKHYYKFKIYGDPLAGRNHASPGEPLRWIDENKNHNSDDCLIWPYEITHHGYGTVNHNGKKRVASRVMCEFAHGEPESIKMDAAHSCGKGHAGCVNPKHLRWATRSQNISDAKGHGTFWEGRVKASSMTEDQARIAIELKGIKKQSEIAEMLGVSVASIAHIHCGKTWQRVADSVGAKMEKTILRGEKSGNAKLTEDDVRAIRSLRGKMKQTEIGKIYGINASYVSCIQLRKWWGWLE